MNNLNNDPSSLNSQQQQNPAATANILWMAFLFSVGTFVAVLFLTITEPQPLSLDPEEFIFGFLAATNAALSVFLPKMMGPKKEPGSVAPNEGFTHKDFVPFVIRMALAESVGVFGVVLGMLKENIEVAAPFFVISFFCVLMGKPKS